MNITDIKTRTDLAKYFAQLGYKVGAEIGVLSGGYAKVLCEAISHLKYYGIAPWYDGKNVKHPYWGKYELAMKNLAPYDATLIKKYSLDAVGDFKDNSLDFVYIDGDHVFDSVVMDIFAWIKKVKKGGIVAGHDYVSRGKVGVIPAVNSYVQAHELDLHLTTEPAETISWWFVKKWNT